MRVLMLFLAAVWALALSFSTVANTTGIDDHKQNEEFSGWLSEAYAANKRGRLLGFKFSTAPHFYVAAESWPPHVYVNKEADGTLKIKGPMGQLMDVLAESLNFTYTPVQKDGYFGAPLPNGSWNGMIGTVLRGEAEIGMGPFGISYTRKQVVDFTTPIFTEMLHILVSRPLPEPDPWGFLAPFMWYVWLGLLLMLLAMLANSLVIVRILGFGGPKSVGHHVWAFYSTTFTQSLPWVPTSVALRVNFGIWMLILFVVIRSYSGALTSLLAVKTLTLKYDSLRDVLDDPSITLLMEGSTALTDHLKTVKEGVYEELARAANDRATYIRASETYHAAYSLMPNGHYAMLTENVVGRKIYSEHFSMTGSCSYHMSSSNFWRLIECMIVPKGSPLLKILGVRIRAITEFGIYEKWELDQMPNITHCMTTPKKVKLHEPYSMADLWAVFLILFCGDLIAFAVFLVENMMPQPITHNSVAHVNFINRHYPR